MRVETVQATGPGTSLLGPLWPRSERFPGVILTSGDLKSLADILSTLCPKDSEEKRSLDATLLAVPR